MTLRSAILLTVLALVVPGARAQTSLDLSTTAPGSADLVLRWESESPGPFNLLRRTLPEGSLPADALPLDPVADLKITGVTSPLLLPGSGSDTDPPGTSIYVISDAAGACSNAGYVIRVRLTPAPTCLGSWSGIAVPWRSSMRDARSLLQACPALDAVRVFDAPKCRELTLWRGPSGLVGRNGYIRPGQGVLVKSRGGGTLVLTGAAEPSPRPLALADMVSCRPATQALALSPGAPERDAFDILCGPGWPDADGDRIPDACPAGLYGPAATEIQMRANARLPLAASQSAENCRPSCLFQGSGFPVLEGIAVDLAGTTRAPPLLQFSSSDAGAAARCRCADRDGDGDDDCTERLRGTDPMDAASFGPDSDGDGIRDDLDACPTDAGGSDADGDGAGDACDACPADPSNACNDPDGDGLQRGLDGCECVPNPAQEDTDGDGIQDACDPRPRDADPCERGAYPPGEIDPCGGDPDGDGVATLSDNCAGLANADQSDVDGDGIGDPCEWCPLRPDWLQDADADGFSDTCDTCPLVANPAQADADADRVGDACDPAAASPCCPSLVRFHAAWLDALASDGSTQARPPRLSADLDGGVYLLMTRDISSAPAPVLAVSRDDGQAWETNAAVFSPAAEGEDVQGFAAGQVVAAWLEAGQVLARQSPDQGRTFGATRQLAATGGGAPWIATAPDGRALVHWRTAAGDIAVVMSADAGRTWDPARLLGALIEDTVEPAAALFASGVILAWPELGSLAPTTSRTINGGATWTAPSALTTAPSSGIRLASAGADAIVAVLQASRGPGLRGLASLDGGAAWAPVEEIFPDAYLAAIAATPAGDVHVAGLAPDGLQVRTSRNRGLAGTWQPIVDPAPESTRIDDFTIAAGNGRIFVPHADYRIGVAGESTYVSESCGAGDAWARVETRLDVEPEPMSDHSESVTAVPGRSGRMHVAWVNVAIATSLPGLEYSRLDPTATAVLQATSTAGPCGRPSWRLDADAGTTAAGCAAPEWRWTIDGVRVPGVATPFYDVPGDLPPGLHDFAAEIWCEGLITCGGRTPAVSLDVAAGAGPVAGTQTPGPMLVAKDIATLRFRWREDAPAPTVHSIYEGTLPPLTRLFAYDHAPRECHLTRPAGASDLSADLPMPAGSRYFLIVPADCGAEGITGFSSRGTARPVSPGGVACGPAP